MTRNILISASVILIMMLMGISFREGYKIGKEMGLLRASLQLQYKGLDRLL